MTWKCWLNLWQLAKKARFWREVLNTLCTHFRLGLYCHLAHRSGEHVSLRGAKVGQRSINNNKHSQRVPVFAEYRTWCWTYCGGLSLSVWSGARFSRSSLRCSRAEAALFHCSLRVVTPARCVNATGPSRAGGRQRKWIQQKKIGLRQRVKAEGKWWNSFWGRSTWLAEGHDCNEPCIEQSSLEHYTSVGKIALKGHSYCSGPSSLLQQYNTKLITQQWVYNRPL